MLSRILDLVLGYLKGKPYWPIIEPFVTLVVLYFLTLIFAYQYIEWRYHFSPSFHVYITSYVVKQISLGFVAVSTLTLLFGTSGRRTDSERWKNFGAGIRIGAKKLILAGTVVAISLGLFLRLAPHQVSQITIRYLDEPTFNKYAFTYIVYELNRSQANWHYNIKFDTFDPSWLNSEERSQCDDDRLCYAKTDAKGDAYIGITGEQLGQDHFWQNSESVSVVSVKDWDLYSPPSIYEYLAYSLVVQSTVIHLNRNCRGLPVGAFQQDRAAYGDLFEFSPRRNELKAAILAAHLSPYGEELLANCFGLEYMNNCNSLLSLDWLRTGRVRENLDTSFKVKF